MSVIKIIPQCIRDFFRPLKDPARVIINLIIRLTSKNRVMMGPFKGMSFVYPQMEYAMLLGTWEMELDSVWEEVLDNNYSVMIDVGAAEGYYAVGMAFRKPGVKVIAYEMDGTLRQKMALLGRLNGATIDIRGKCEPQDLAGFGEQLEGAFILMDVEGYESELLDPAGILQLSKASILVELHDMYVEDCTAMIESRFQSSHDIHLIKGEKRTIDHFPETLRYLKGIFPIARLMGYMDEGRPHEMHWFWMTPKLGSLVE